MRKKLLSISLFLVLSMFMTSCILIEGPGQYDDDPLPTDVTWRTYTAHQHFVYKECEEDGLEMNTISFYLGNGVWTTEHIRESIDTTKRIVYFDYSFDNPHGTIYIGDSEWLDESYSFTCSMGEGKITLYSADGDTLNLWHKTGW